MEQKSRNTLQIVVNGISIFANLFRYICLHHILFHIPVMGTAFTADSPIKVGHYGINTVIALADDVLLERLRKYYSRIYDLSYKEIKNDTKDYRADRITSYLNMVNKVVSARI